MNVTNNSMNNNPSFGRIIKTKKLYDRLCAAGNSDRIEFVINSQRTNPAADIIMTDTNVYVKDNKTGDLFFPTGKILQWVSNPKYTDFIEYELEKKSALQKETRDAAALKKLHYLGSKMKWNGFLNFSIIKNYFEKKSPTSYVVEQAVISKQGIRNKPDAYLGSEAGEFDKIISKFNACLDIAHDIKSKSIKDAD